MVIKRLKEIEQQIIEKKIFFSEEFSESKFLAFFIEVEANGIKYFGE